MKILKKYDCIYKFIFFIILLSFTLTTINLIFNFSPNIIKLIILLSMITYSFIIGFKKGLKADNKGYIIGLKTGLINILILFILSLLTLTINISLKKLIYYLIILISTIFGSIIGINKKNSN